MIRQNIDPTTLQNTTTDDLKNPNITSFCESFPSIFQDNSSGTPDDQKRCYPGEVSFNGRAAKQTIKLKDGGAYPSEPAKSYSGSILHIYVQKKAGLQNALISIDLETRMDPDDVDAINDIKAVNYPKGYHIKIGSFNANQIKKNNEAREWGQFVVDDLVLIPQSNDSEFIISAIPGITGAYSVSLKGWLSNTETLSFCGAEDPKKKVALLVNDNLSS